MKKETRRLATAAAQDATLSVAALALCVAAPARAGELGHYSPAIADIRDYMMPAKPGFYFKEYDLFYTTHTFKDRNGDSVKSFPLPGGGTATPKIDVNLFVLAPTFMWLPDWDVLGGHYGAYIIPTFGNTSLGASLRTETGFGRSVDDSSFGVGDLFVEPLWLGWNREHWDFNVGYGFYAPVGKYDSGAADNIGLGFWSHQLQGAVAWYPVKDRTTAIVAAVTYEFNQEVKDSDITPGQRLSINLGADQLVPLGASGFVLDLGAGLYGQWQTTNDTGSEALQPGVHDQVYGIGPEIGLIYVPWEAAATLKWQHEFLAHNRFEGDYLTLNFAAAF